MGHSVLVVDDDAEIRQLLSTMLSFVGFQLETAVDGVDALTKIAQQPPDVLILDVMMPKMDGLTLCKKLRQQEQTAQLPIILLSGKAHIEAINEGLQAGANRYLTKPAAMDELKRSVEEVLSERIQKRRPEA